MGATPLIFLVKIYDLRVLYVGCVYGFNFVLFIGAMEI